MVACFFFRGNRIRGTGHTSAFTVAWGAKKEKQKARNNPATDLQRETFSVIGIFCTIVLSLGNAAKQQ